LTLFSARTHEGFFWTSRPAPILLGAASLALTLSTILSIVWPRGTLDDITVEGTGRHPQQGLFAWVWLYCLLVWLLQDFLKVSCYQVLLHYNVFGIRDTKSHKNLAEMDLDAEQEPLNTTAKPVHTGHPVQASHH